MNFIDFLSFVKNKWAKFYYFTVFFTIMTLTSAFIVGQSITPFYVFQMYSQSLSTQNTYVSFNIEINGKKFNIYNLSKERRDVVFYNFKRYIQLKENNGYDKYYLKLKQIDKYSIVPNFIYNQILFVDISDTEKNKKWLLNLLFFDYDEKIVSIKIDKVEYYFDSNNKVEIYSRTPIDYFLYD